MSTAAFNPDDYLRHVRLSGLVADERLTQALQDFKRQRKPLTQFLIDSNLLTPWQNQKLLEGKHKGFFLRGYKLLGHIGLGGMSSVYLAEQTALRRRVAIRVLSQAESEDADYLARLYRQTQTPVDHPSLVRVFDVDNENRIHFVVMEFIEGQDLGTVVGKSGPLPQAKAAEYIRQAADGLACVHERGLVHGDIKPSALLLDRSSRIRIGLGMMREAGDARNDVYSLGCTLYFLLMGRTPSLTGPDDSSTRQIYADWLEERGEIEEAQRQRNWPAGKRWLPPLAFCHTNASPALVKICEKMMAAESAHRYQTCGAVCDVLRIWLANHAGE